MLVLKSHPTLTAAIPYEDFLRKHNHTPGQLEAARNGWQMARDSYNNLVASNRNKIGLLEKNIDGLKKKLNETKLHLKNEINNSIVYMQNWERAKKDHAESQKTLDISLCHVKELTNSQDELCRDSEKAIQFRDQAFQVAQIEIESLRSEVQRGQSI